MKARIDVTLDDYGRAHKLNAAMQMAQRVGRQHGDDNALLQESLILLATTCAEFVTPLLSQMADAAHEWADERGKPGG